MRLRELLTPLGFKEFNVVKYEKHVEREFAPKVKIVDRSRATYVDKRVIILPAFEMKDEMLGKAEDILEAKAGFVRDDLLLPEVGMLATASRSKKVLQAFRGCVDPAHFRAMIAAASVVHWEDIGEHTIADKTFGGLVRKLGGDGRKIYNFHRSGYLEGYFLAELAMMKFQSTAQERYKENFVAFFRQNLLHFRFAIWSNEFTSLGDIREALDKRFKTDTVATVRVYGRGEGNIEKVEEMCEAYALANPHLVYLFNKEYYRIGRQRACCITLQRRGKSVHEPRDETARMP